MTVRILPHNKTPATLPRSVMGHAPSGSHVAYVFYERVRHFASERNMVAGLVLGHVVAHEIGHILLGSGHSDTGLMRATWEEPDLSLAQRGLFVFTPEQSLRMRITGQKLLRRDVPSGQ